MPSYALSILGRFCMRDFRGASIQIRPIDRAVLGVIATSPSPVPRESIADTVWGASRPTRDLLHSLAQSIYRMRMCAPEALTEGTDHSIGLSPHCRTDIWLLRDPRTRARTVTDLAQPITVLSTLRSPSVDFDIWRDGLTAELRSIAYDAVRATTRTEVRDRNWERAIDVGVRAAMHQPLCRELALLLMQAAIMVSDENAAQNYLNELFQSNWPHSEDARRKLAEAWTSTPRSPMRLRRIERSAGKVIVGRQDELARLVANMTIPNSEPCVVTISGERGIGKTRLLLEATKRLVGTSVRVLYTKCYPTGSRISYAAVESLIRENVSDDDWHNLDMEHYEGARRLFDISSVRQRVPTAKIERVHAYRRRRLLVFSAIIEAVRQQHRTVLAFDDVQWLDAASANLISEYLRTSNATNALILSGVQDSHSSDALGLLIRELAGFPKCTIDLRPLSMAESAAFASSIAIGSGDETISLITRAGCGNPLIMVEMAGLAAAIGKMPSTDDLSRDASAIVDHRLQDLSDVENKLMNIAALADRPVSLATLAAVSREDDVVVHVAVEELVRRSLIARLPERAGYVPVNELIVARCRSRLADPLQKYVFRRLAEDAEQRGQKNSIIAEYLTRAGGGPRSAKASLAATKECLAAGDYETAVHFLESATETLNGNARLERVFKLYCEKLIELGQLERAESLLREWATDSRFGRLAEYVDILRHLNGGDCSIIDLLSRLKDLYGHEPEWLSSTALLTDFLGTCVEVSAYAHDRAFFNVALDRLINLAQLETKVSRAVEQAALASRLACLSNGSVDAVALSDLCAEIGKGSTDRLVQLRVYMAQGAARWYSGELRAAQRIYTEALELCGNGGLFYFRWRILVERGALLIDLGRPHQAVRELVATLSTSSDRERAYALANLGAAAFELVDHELLTSVAERLNRINQQLGVPWIDVVALSYSGFAHLLAGNASLAFESMNRIVSVLDRHRGLALNEPSYTYIFCLRAIEEVVGPEAALAFVNRYVSGTVGISAAADLRIRLEVARLQVRNHGTESANVLEAAIEGAEQMEAQSSILSANWLRRQARGANFVGWRRMASIHASASGP